MKKIIVGLIGLMFWGEGYAQRFLRPYDQKLDSLYRVLIKDPESVRKQQEFLEYFPDNFEDFRKTYGYNPKYSKKDPMYTAGEEHVYKGLARLDKLPDTLYYTKLIKLSIGGKWVADAISALQETVQKKTMEKPQLLLSLLSQYSPEKIYSFWYFYFNSLKEEFPQFFSKCSQSIPKYIGSCFVLLKIRMDKRHVINFSRGKGVLKSSGR